MDQERTVTSIIKEVRWRSPVQSRLPEHGGREKRMPEVSLPPICQASYVGTGWSLNELTSGPIQVQHTSDLLQYCVIANTHRMTIIFLLLFLFFVYFLFFNFSHRL